MVSGEMMSTVKSFDSSVLDKNVVMIDTRRESVIRVWCAR
jgi:hypothetical protein